MHERCSGRQMVVVDSRGISGKMAMLKTRGEEVQLHFEQLGSYSLLVPTGAMTTSTLPTRHPCDNLCLSGESWAGELVSVSSVGRIIEYRP